MPSGPAPLTAPTRAQTALAVGLLALLYLWVFPYHAAVNNPNENVRVYMTVAIVDDHTFAINRVERDWGYVNDKSVRNGRLYSSKAPGSSYVGVPVYWLLTKLTGRSSLPLTPAQIAAHHKPPLDKTVVIYVLRLACNVLPGLVFAWFWHRFLGRQTRSATLRDAVFFSTMVGSLLYAYSEMFASHALNAFCAMGALMALAAVRERDARDEHAGRARALALGPMFVAGLLGAAATMFEYPAAAATIAIALLVLATAVERRVSLAPVAMVLAVAAAGLVALGHRRPGLGVMVLAAAGYLATLRVRSALRLVVAGIGGALPTALTLFYHQRCFGSPFKPGYSYLENPEFREMASHGFFGAAEFSWEAALRLYVDPSFGAIATTPVLLAAVMGFGAYFAWSPPARWRAAVQTICLTLVVALGVATARALAAVHASGWAGPAGQHAGLIAWLVLAVVALGAVTLRRPAQADPALAAAILLACYAQTRLIGTMNNWRGGWTVGPRYLATLVPFLGFLALVGLDALARCGPVRRRIVTVFAAASTLVALLVSGIPSAYFPHIPTEFASPLFDLFVPLVQGGYAPRNAAQFFGHVPGLRGMVPVFIAALVAVWLVFRGDERRAPGRLAHALSSTALACVLLTPFALLAKPDTAPVRHYVEHVFEPQPQRSVAAPRPATPTASPDAESLRAQGRAMAARGDASGALQAFQRAARAAR